MVLFAGVGPFVAVIAKSHKDAHVVGIEKNPYAYKMMKQNIMLNRIKNVTAEKGDVKSKSEAYGGFADRIVMPLPWSGINFLDTAVQIAKPEAIIHLYVFGETESVLDDSWNSIEKHAKKNRYTAKLLFSRVVRPYSAEKSEIVIDFRIRKVRKGRHAAPKCD
jgi:tRNA G37 N-methylase Trm5